MNEQQAIRQQAEAVLDLSDAMLAAAIEGHGEKMDGLTQRRAELIERMFSAAEAAGDSRVMLAGVMEQVRKLDTTTRSVLDRDRSVDSSEDAGCESMLDWFEGDGAFLDPGRSEADPTEARRGSLF
jgi:hypothetical protein